MSRTVTRKQHFGRLVVAAPEAPASDANGIRTFGSREPDVVSGVKAPPSSPVGARQGRRLL